MKGRAAGVVDLKLEYYIKSLYPAASLSEAIQKLLPKAKVTPIGGTGVVPSEPTDIPPATVAAAKEAYVVVLYIGGRSAWFR